MQGHLPQVIAIQRKNIEGVELHFLIVLAVVQALEVGDAIDAALLLKPDSMPDDARAVMLKEADVSARVLGVQLQVVEAQGPADFDGAFSKMSAKGVGALVVH